MSSLWTFRFGCQKTHVSCRNYSTRKKGIIGVEEEEKNEKNRVKRVDELYEKKEVKIVEEWIKRVDKD